MWLGSDISFEMAHSMDLFFFLYFEVLGILKYLFDRYDQVYYMGTLMIDHLIPWSLRQFH